MSNYFVRNTVTGAIQRTNKEWDPPADNPAFDLFVAASADEFDKFQEAEVAARGAAKDAERKLLGDDDDNQGKGNQ